MIHTSAPAKLILFGEHASRHGKPCLVFAINQRLHVFLKPRTDGRIFLTNNSKNLKNIEYPTAEEDLKFVSASIKNFFDETKKSGGFELETKSEIVEGFGSSAAAVVATLGALDTYFKTNLGKEKIFRFGVKTIQEIQGFGSGLDVAASTYGGLINYIKDQVPVQIPHKGLPLVVGNTGIKAKSKPIVEAVKKLEKDYPEILKSIIDNMGRIASEAEKAIKEGDLNKVGQLMNFNQGMLYAEGVSSEILEKLIFAAKHVGAVGAKISGAGIGDNMLALAPGKIKEAIDAINKAGGKAMEVKIDEGLKIY